jgi:transposase
MRETGTITLSNKELQRATVLNDCTQGRLTCARAAALLGLSLRHCKRLKRRYGQGGAAALAHVNRGRPSPRRLPQPLRQRILRLARTTYAGLNDHHLCEKLGAVEDLYLSRETLRRLLRGAGIGPPRKRRPPAHRQRRPPREREGELLQVDASPHDWLQGRGPRLTLLGFQDDATGKVVGAEFCDSESALGYFRVFRSLLRRYGVPLALYGDRCAVFVRNDEHWTLEEELAGRRQPTQFGRALEQLGVTFIPAQSPQAKGRIERLWGVFQDRLVSELRLAGAVDLPSANAVLRRFLSNFNRRFGRAPARAEKAWRAAPRNLERICCFVHERVVSHDNVVQWDGRCLQIPPQPHRPSFGGARVQLELSLAGHLALYHGDTKLSFSQTRG